MSFTTALSKPYKVDSWFHMQQQQHEQQVSQYAKSTASSRSRQRENEPIAMLRKKSFDDTRRRKSTTTTTSKPPINEPASSYLSQGRRRQTLSGPVNPQKPSSAVMGINTGLIKLADTLRDTLAMERRLAQQELGLLDSSKRKPPIRNSTIANTAKLRTPTTAAEEQTYVRRRTYSSGAALLPSSHLQQQSSNKRVTPTEPASYMKPTLADQQKRKSNAPVSPLLAHSRRNSQNVVRRKSMTVTTTKNGRESSSSLTTSEEESNKLKRRSILAVATAKARQQQQQCPDLVTEDMSGDETRKKSSSLLDRRRMSRTESLKEGVATSSSSRTSPLAATRMSRRKSVLQQESPVNNNNKSPTKKNTTQNTTTKLKARKRGKTLPGNLAKPPAVTSLQLPPMKIEPIKLTIPPETTAARTPKQLASRRRKSTASAKANRRVSISSISPLTTSSSSSSSSSLSSKKSTSKLKRQSLLGVPDPTSAAARRRASLQKLDASTSKKLSPVIRPATTGRRPSLVTTHDTLLQTTQKPMSHTAVNGRKNSVMTDDKGRHRAISLKEKLEAMVAEYDTETRQRSIRKKSSTMELTTTVPKTPTTILKSYGHMLSPYEQTEIQSYAEVYFVGQHCAFKHQAMPDQKGLNYGYDDGRGDYRAVRHDHLGYRYEILDELGRGSFGQVVKCLDHKTGQHVAVKLIRNKKRFYAQAKTEVRILSDLVKWDPEDKHHNVRMIDRFYFRSHLCIASECLSMNLYEFIKVNNFQGFHVTLIKRFAIQILRSLSLLSKHGIIHCDLKPENILLKHPTKSTIKVIDFGSSCLESQRVYTYIQSRFYRSPEIILGLDYTMAIDMWSVGCIMAELYTGVPIFPGENEQEQLACIMEVLGVPDEDLIQLSERKHLFFDCRGQPRVVCNSRGKRRKPGTKSLAQVLRCQDTLFLDFIQQCLQWNPSKRLTPEKAFEHEWILQQTNAANRRTVEDASSADTVVTSGETS
ncbi:MAG: kinase-like domain-containing protein [Benjaminiella poitrasii]|nr:MAG: kinase-like domain-containing protein [Benjaminiella poitrasii]